MPFTLFAKNDVASAKILPASAKGICSNFTERNKILCKFRYNFRDYKPVEIKTYTNCAEKIEIKADIHSILSISVLYVTIILYIWGVHFINPLNS